MGGPVVTGAQDVSGAVMPLATTPITSALIIIPSSFPMTLNETQTQAVEGLLTKVDFMTIRLQDVATLCDDTEKALHQTLDGFLVRIGKMDNPKIFKMVTQLSEAVKKEDLPALADKILNNKPGFFESLRAKMNRKSAAEAAEQLWLETKNLVQGKTKTLVDTVNSMERELQVEQVNLNNEIQSMDQLKNAYRDRFNDFVIAAAFMSAFFERAKTVVETTAQSIDQNNIVEKQQFDELRDKLQALESRALALEGTLTRLPADQLVIRQLQQSGIQTLQEVQTTASSRFASIKMTLVTINGAMVTRGVQQLADQGAALDSNLTAVRGLLMKDVIAKSANAAGDNRLAQAEQLRNIIKETTELATIAEQARVSNQDKFTKTREMFSTARQEMLTLNTTIRQ